MLLFFNENGLLNQNGLPVSWMFDWKFMYSLEDDYYR